MEAVRRLFGGPREVPPPPSAIAPVDTKGSFEKLNHSLATLERLVDASVDETDKILEEAKQCERRGQRDAALAYMMHIKRNEIQFTNLVNLKLGYETTVMHLRTAEALSVTMAGMDEALVVMKQLAATVNPEAAAEVAEKIEKRQLQIKATQAILSKNRGGIFPKEFDETELEAELQSIMSSEVPAVATSAPVAKPKRSPSSFFPQPEKKVPVPAD